MLLNIFFEAGNTHCARRLTDSARIVIDVFQCRADFICTNSDYLIDKVLEYAKGFFAYLSNSSTVGEYAHFF